MNLAEYIKREFKGNKAEFARRMEVNPQQVTKWINDGWIVDGHILYSPRRAIPENGA